MHATTVSGADPLAAGRAALERADWAEARARFEAAAAADDVPEAWEGLSRAAWWQGDQEATMGARERAYRAYRRGGDACAAARMAMWLASDHIDFRGDDAVASAWLRRGRALLGDREPCAEQGFIMLHEADIALFAEADPAAAARLAREGLDLARRIPDRGVEVVALAILGSALITSGAIEEGLRRLDESGALAVGEEFSETSAPGWALCHTVSACADVGDFGRAAQWCRALHTWSAAWRARHFFGLCRTAYGEVLATGGAWQAARAAGRSRPGAGALRGGAAAAASDPRRRRAGPCRRRCGGGGGRGRPRPATPHRIERPRPLPGARAPRTCSRRRGRYGRRERSGHSDGA